MSENRPTENPIIIATDANYTTGPFPGLDNKAVPSSGTQAEGFLPGEKVAAENLNYILNNYGEYIEYFDGYIGQEKVTAFTTAGSFPSAWTKPNGCRYVEIVCVGGGGGSRSASLGGSPTGGAGGASSGQMFEIAVAAESLADVLSVTVGAGGVQGAAGATSSVTNVGGSIVYVTATGGFPGGFSAALSGGGSGGGEIAGIAAVTQGGADGPQSGHTWKPLLAGAGVSVGGFLGGTGGRGVYCAGGGGGSGRTTAGSGAQGGYGIGSPYQNGGGGGSGVSNSGANTSFPGGQGSGYGAAPGGQLGVNGGAGFRSAGWGSGSWGGSNYVNSTLSGFGGSGGAGWMKWNPHLVPADTISNGRVGIVIIKAFF